MTGVLFFRGGEELDKLKLVHRTTLVPEEGGGRSQREIEGGDFLGILG